MRNLALWTNEKDETYFVLSFSYDPNLVMYVKKIPGRKFDKKSKTWMTRADHISAKYVNVFCDHFGFEIESAAKELIENLLKPVKENNIELPPLKMKLRPFQEVGVAYATKYERCIIADEMGLGKAQSIFSKILTPDGWKLFKNIKIGDEIMNSEGGISNISGVYPQGMKDLYRVTFSDGSSTVTCDEHLWAVKTALQKFRKSEYKIKPLCEIKNDLIKPGKNRKNKKWFIPLVEPVQFKEKLFHIDPYVMGVLIGDGGLTKGARFTSNDADIIEKIKTYLPIDLKVHSRSKKENNMEYDIVKKDQDLRFANNSYVTELKSLGLFGKKSNQKFIPEIYKFNSVKNRISLLHGLIDTDGFVDKSGYVLQYYTVSKQLCDDVIFLAQSLGGTVKTHIKHPIFIYKGKKKEGQVCYTLTISLPDKIAPCSLNRKLSRFKKKTKYPPYRAMISVEYIGRGEAICIKTTAENHLYITDDFIVTHNTAQSIASVEKLNAYPCLVICPASLKLNWKKEINMWVNRTVQIIEGLADEENPPVYDADFIVINYDIVSKGKSKNGKVPDDDLADAIDEEKDKSPMAHKDFLAEHGFKSIIIDESHAIKNYKSQRSRAIKKIAKGIKYRFALTGTPLLNKPKELIPQLEALDKLDAMGGFWGFAKKYCGAVETEYGWALGDATNMPQLNEKLKEVCMIRRLKKDVMSELPPKQRTYMPIEIDNAEEYKMVEKDFVKWVKKKLIDPQEYKKQVDEIPNLTKSQKKMLVRAMIKNRLDKARRTEALVKIEYLKQVVARGKVAKFIEFIDNAIEQGSKLVVFAVHREIQDKLYEYYKDKNCARIFSEDDMNKRNANVEKFQEDESCRLMIASLAAGGVGLTLTASSTVAFMEFGWTPAVHDQAEDRCISKGQLIYTRENGIIPIENAKVGNSVLTHNSNFKKILNIKKRNHRGLFTEIKYYRYNQPLICTHDHKILCHSDGKIQWIEAYKLLPGDCILMPNNLPTVDVDYIEIPGRHWHEDIQYNQYGNKQKNGRFKPIPKSIKIDNDLLYLFGWYIAEGWVGFNKNKLPKSVSICGHEKEINTITRISEYIKNTFGINYKIYKSKKNKGISATYYSIEFASWFLEMFGTGSYNKKVPNFLMDLPKNKVQTLLHAYIDGDGYRRNNTEEFITTSSTLAYQMSLLMIKCGKIPCLRKINGNHNDKCWVGMFSNNANPSNKKLNLIDELYIYSPVQEVKTYNGKVDVYDLEIEDDHSFVVGFSTVHNCHRIGQTDSVNCYYFYCDKTIDNSIIELIDRKRKIIDAIVDGKIENLENDESDVEEILNKFI